MSDQFGKANRPWRSKRVWVAGIAIAAAVHGVGLLLFHPRSEWGEPSSDHHGSRIMLVGPGFLEEGNDSLWEYALLRDSEPLFLPTRWNNSQALPAPALYRRPADLFAPYSPKWSYAENDFGLREEVFQTPVRTAMETYRQWQDPVLTTFGHRDVGVPVLPPRQARLAFTLPTGEVLRIADVRMEETPSELNQLWLPAEFTLQVGNIGLIGEPVLVLSSGSEAVDRFLRGALRRELLDQGLPPSGYYRILAGP